MAHGQRRWEETRQEGWGGNHRHEESQESQSHSGKAGGKMGKWGMARVAGAREW